MSVEIQIGLVPSNSIDVPDTVEYSLCEECNTTLDFTIKLMKGMVEKPVEVFVYASDAADNAATGRHVVGVHVVYYST